MSRKSSQRDAILKVVKITNSHPGADWIYEQVKNEIPNISMGTIYRNLRLLVDTGEVKEINIPGIPSRFDGNTSDHHHLLCKKCGRIFDLDESVSCNMEDEIFKKTGFKAEVQYLKFIGLCSDCQEQDKTQYMVSSELRVKLI
jgi:Fur family peroxide stress response transcriptional regulator